MSARKGLLRRCGVSVEVVMGRLLPVGESDLGCHGVMFRSTRWLRDPE